MAVMGPGFLIASTSREYLDNIELVVIGGESDVNARPLDYAWVLNIREQCMKKNINFEFRQCGTNFIKDGKLYKLQTKDLIKQAKLANIDYKKYYKFHHSSHWEYIFQIYQFFLLKIGKCNLVFLLSFSNTQLAIRLPLQSKNR